MGTVTAKQASLALFGLLVTIALWHLYGSRPSSTTTLKISGSPAVEEVQNQRFQFHPAPGKSLGTAQDQGKDCWWAFDKYMPSKYEKRWYTATTARHRDPCSRLSRAVASSLDLYWKEYHKLTLCTSEVSCPPISRLNQTFSQKPPAPPVEMSRFRYKKMCGSSAAGKALYHSAPADGPDYYYVVIEPLVGALRHPMYCFDETMMVDKDYMFYSDPWLVQLESEKARASNRFLYYDAGASLWDAGAGGASQGWMIPEFTNRWCLPNDGVWAWEAIKHDPDKVFGLLPSCLHPVYRWFNIKVSADQNNSANIWRHLEATARPEDFVVVKVDIDTPAVENPLMREFAASPHLHLLVDEMFFEYHCDYEPICTTWQICNDPSVPTYKDALRLFLKIRQGGARIHSWV